MKQRMKMKSKGKKIICAIIFLFAGQTLLGSTNSLAVVQTAWNQLTNQVPIQECSDCLTIYEPLNFNSFSKRDAYKAFAQTISNDWASILTSFSLIGTNETERLAVLGIGKCFSEDFYISYCTTLADLQHTKIISDKELRWGLLAGRYDLHTCLIRRYRESPVTNLITKLIVSFPAEASTWNEIMQGITYTNYVDEIESGLW